MELPLNRIVAFFGPYISLLAAGLITWLAAKVNIAGIPGLDQDNLTTAVAAGLTFLLTAGLTWLGQQQWLKGHHIQILADAEITAAALAPVSPEEALPTITDAIDDPEVEAAAADVPDNEELAAPPPIGSSGGTVHE